MKIIKNECGDEPFSKYTLWPFFLYKSIYQECNDLSLKTQLAFGGLCGKKKIFFEFFENYGKLG